MNGTDMLGLVSAGGTGLHALVSLVVAAGLAQVALRASRGPSGAAPWLGAAAALTLFRVVQTLAMWPLVSLSYAWVGVDEWWMVQAAGQGLSLVSTTLLWGALGVGCWRLTAPAEASPWPADSRGEGSGAENRI